MYLKDFVFDGMKLSTFGFVIGSIVTGMDDSNDMGSILKIDTIKNNSNYTSEIINTSYEDNISCTFDILHCQCMNGFKETMRDDEISHFMRWLNSKQYKKFIPVYDMNEYNDTFFYGTFTQIKTIKINGNVVGLTLTFTANAPYGFRDEKERTFSLTTGTNFMLVNKSDEIGILYPKKVQVTCNSQGSLVLCIDKEPNRKTIVENCVSGEIISFDSVHKVITSSVNHDGLYNDFNYVFPRLLNGNNFVSISSYTKNDTTIDGVSCTITTKYEPIRKVGIII